MKITVLEPVEVDVDAIRCVLPCRYEDEDIPYDFPFRKKDVWEVVLDVNTGKIRDWPGPEARVSMKVFDCGCYYLLSGDKVVGGSESDYVPDCIPQRYGDYIDFDIAADGTLRGWKPNAEKITECLIRKGQLEE